MMTAKQILYSITKATQTGQAGIQSVLDTSMRPGLRKALETQLREYRAIESEAFAIAAQRGWDLPELDPAVILWTRGKAKLKLHGRNTDSKIADLIILNNTKDMIRGIKDIRQFPDSDSQVTILCQKLLDCETAGIRQMQGFL